MPMFTKMTEPKKNQGIAKEIEIPEGVEVLVDGSIVTVKGQKGENKREFPSLQILMEKKGNLFAVSGNDSRRKNKAMAGTIIAHVSNMIKGVTQGYVFKLKAVHSHFPMTFKVQGIEFTVENFLGSKSKITVKLPEGVKVDAKGSDITVQGINKEKVAQASATIEHSTYVSNKDRRVFQDGVYLVERDGVPV